MMSTDRITVWVALLGSVVLHLFVLLPGLVQASAPAEKEIQEAAVNESEFKRRVEKEDVEELHLGIDESEASTLTWVGY